VPDNDFTQVYVMKKNDFGEKSYKYKEQYGEMNILEE